jgi:hypothetical protein
MTNPILIDIPTIKDPDGVLGVVDFPFFRRTFWVRDAVGMRGRHSHLSCVQLLIPLVGTFMIILSKDGLGKREMVISENYPQGVLVPPGWCITYSSIQPPPSLLLVLATESYDQDIVIPCDEEDIYEYPDN